MTATCPVCDREQIDGLMCHSCVSQLERELGDVAAIVHELEVTLSRQSRIGSGGKAGPAHERTPAHLGAMQAADDLGNTLTTWARDVENMPTPGRWILRDATRIAAAVLMSNVDVIRRHPAAAELHDEILDAVRTARRAVDRPADRVYLGICYFEEAGVTCMEELYGAPGASEVRCRTCGITHEVAERRAWLLKQAEDMLFTVQQAAQMVGEVGRIKVTEASIRGYIHRKRLAYRPGTTTIRLGDLLTVVLEQSEKKSA